ncbi:MAG: inositol monophosphatase family protein [Chloroflexota bacterium]
MTHHSQVSSLADDLALALNLADLADEIVRSSFQPQGFAFENKYDGTPVTAIDRAVEEALRQRMAIERPDHVVLGEEAGLGGGSEDGRPRWIVDPIDGTRKFVRGIPIFATLLALEVGGEIVLGVASAPMMNGTGRRWWAARGLGAFSDGRRIGVSKVARLEDAHVLHGGLEHWVTHGRSAQILDIAANAWGMTGYGDFWVHLLVAEGAADAAVEAQAAIWDVAALKIIVEEAGGRFTDFDGRPTPAGGNGLSTNGLIHDDLLARLRR